MKLVEDEEIDACVPFLFFEQGPVFGRVIIEIGIGGDKLLGEGGFADLSRTGEKDDFFPEVFADRFFEIPAHVTIMNRTS